MGLIIDSLPYIGKGFINSIFLSFLCIVLSILVGIVVGTISSINHLITKFVTMVYVEIFRGLPVLVTLFLIFFMLPTLGIYINSFFSAMIALSLWASANVAESVRGSIQSIPSAQSEASYSLGLSYFQTMRYVIIPQAFKRMLPSIIGLMTNLIQATSLTVLIGNTEFLKATQNVIERIEVMQGISVSLLFYLLLLVGYFIICYPLSLFSKKLERSLN